MLIKYDIYAYIGQHPLVPQKEFAPEDELLTPSLLSPKSVNRILP